MAQSIQNLAVLVDADNVSHSYAHAVFEEIASIGEPALRRVYGDWSSGQLTQWLEQVRDLGLVAHQQSANAAGKNATDIGLVIDAMDTLHSGRFDGFVLVSSDSDFTALANRIREHGLLAVGIGESKTPDALRNAFNRFILVENLLPGKMNSGTEPKRKPSPKKAESLILSAMDQINPEAEWYHLGQIGQAVISRSPDFDSRTYGEKKLSDLVKKLGFRTKKRGGNRLDVARKAA